MIQNNISQVGEGSENPEKELGALSEMPNRAKITTSFRDFKYLFGYQNKDCSSLALVATIFQWI